MRRYVCTAAETAISIRINEELAASGVGKNASEMIVRNANGIIGLYRLGAQFGLAFSESQSKFKVDWQACEMLQCIEANIPTMSRPVGR